MRTPTTSERNDALIIRDNYPSPLHPSALAGVGFIIVWKNVSSPGGLVIGVGLIVVALLGFIRSTVVFDLSSQTVTVRRNLFGICKSSGYALRRIKSVDTRWTKFGDTLVLTIAVERNVRRVRIAGPSRTDLAHLKDEVRRYLARP